MRSVDTWGDKEHEQTDLTMVLPVSEALRLKALLPRLLATLDQQGLHPPRNPEDRTAYRDARETLQSLDDRLRESLRPFGVPEVSAQEASPLPG